MVNEHNISSKFHSAICAFGWWRVLLFVLFQQKLITEDTMELKHLKEANLPGPVDMIGMIILMEKHTSLCLGIIWAMCFFSVQVITIF